MPSWCLLYIGPFTYQYIYAYDKTSGAHSYIPLKKLAQLFSSQKEAEAALRKITSVEPRTRLQISLV